MFKDRGITFKLILYILTSCTVIFLLIFGYDYIISRKYITQNIDANAKYLSDLTVNRIEAILQSVEEVPETLSFFLEYSSYTKEGLEEILKNVAETNPRIFGAGIFFEPHELIANKHRVAVYYYITEDGAVLRDLGAEGFDYLNRDWYKGTKVEGVPRWSEPYYDNVTGQNVVMATYAVPLYRGKGENREFMGVVAADVSLSWIQKMISSIKMGKTGYGFLVSKDGKFITHPDEGLNLNRSIFDVAKERENARLHEAAQNMAKGVSGNMQYQSLLSGKDSWLIYAPLPTSQWSLGIEFPREEMLSDMIYLDDTVFVLAPIGVALLFIVIYIVSHRITRSLRALDRGANEIAKGNLNFSLPPMGSNDEVGRLSNSFLLMRDSLKKYIEDLTETTASKEKIVSELKIARTIQMSILPRVEPPFANRREFDIYAMLEPAKEVGGDFYDYFTIGKEHICIVIGDVSDKGVPAALLMAVTKTLIKSMAKEDVEPKLIMERINRETYHNNESCSFITAFLGVMNVESGELRYINAGHNPPLIIRGDSVEFLDVFNGTALGAIEGAEYRNERTVLGPEDAIFLYTDGITEAFNTKEELFSEERLVDILRKNTPKSAKTIVKTVLKNVKLYAQGAPRSDDITMLCLRYRPQYSTAKEFTNRTIVLVNDIAEIEKLTKFVVQYGKQNGLSKSVVNDIDLALEEIFTNAVTHGFEPGSLHTILIELDLKEGVITLRVEDDGRPFNPLELPEPDIYAPLKKRPIGGLGVMLTRHSVDDMEYRREGAKNVIIMKKRLEPEHSK